MSIKISVPLSDALWKGIKQSSDENRQGLKIFSIQLSS